MESTKDLSEQDLLAKLSVLHERLVSFYAILSDLECDEARSVVQTQINNYTSTVILFEEELLRRNKLSKEAGTVVTLTKHISGNSHPEEVDNSSRL